MKMKKRGFSLLEFATVLVIISILSGVMYAGVVMHRNAIKTARTRMQFLQYESAIKFYCYEYGNLPLMFSDETLVDLNDPANAALFVKMLSGKNPDGSKLSIMDKENLNPKGKVFHDFRDEEFFLDHHRVRDVNHLADAFNCPQIYIIAEDPFDDDVVIAKSHFPEIVHKYIPDAGVKASVVIFSVSPDGKRVISNAFMDKGF